MGVYPFFVISFRLLSTQNSVNQSSLKLWNERDISIKVVHQHDGNVLRNVPARAWSNEHVRAYRDATFPRCVATRGPIADAWQTERLIFLVPYRSTGNEQLHALRFCAVVWRGGAKTYAWRLLRQGLGVAGHRFPLALVDVGEDALLVHRRQLVLLRVALLFQCLHRSLKYYANGKGGRPQ